MDENSASTTKKKNSRFRRIMLWAIGVIGVLAVAAFIAIQIALHRVEPILRARVIDTLSTRFDSRVELAAFHVYFTDGFQVSGDGLKVFPNAMQSQTPLFAVDEFSFHSSWHGLIRTPMFVRTVHLKGMRIYMPPKDQRKNIRQFNSNSGASGNGKKMQIQVGELLIDNALLVMGTNKPGKLPLEFNISALQMQSIGAGQPMKFHATLINPKPVGNIDSSGYFGPFHTESPGDTPVNGAYRFSNADLSTIKGIGGILSSTGKYQGTLNNIVVDGVTDTPDFRIDSGNHPMPLHTTFHAIVDGTNGDTHLQPVEARLANSHIVAVGDVVRAPQGGHNITLDVSVGPARIEDMLTLAVKTMPPVINGRLNLKTKFFLPPGKVSVASKLHLMGTFHIADAMFSNEKVQARVDQLSLRSQNRAEEASAITKESRADIQSEMAGDFELNGGKLTFNSLEYKVPGADIALTGIYSLDGNQFDFHGKARLKAKVSQLTTGWKSLLLMPVDPFFSKHGAGTEVPFKISGTRSEPKFGLDFGRKEEKH